MMQFIAGVVVGEVITVLLLYMGHNWYLIQKGGGE
ncbi:MAG: hypothetical protein K0Q73_7541 [Paenibacillus sp.]|jgi:hypothetical protein|nr:hypothetical protein [Paenibacillus sp.]